MSKEWGFLCSKATDHNEEEAERACIGRDQPHEGPRQPLHHKVIHPIAIWQFSSVFYLSRFIEAFEMDKGIVLVTELLQGGELFERCVDEEVKFI